jgi:hypothetical protein
MAKGIGHFGNRKHSHYEFKRRCEVSFCKKRAKYFINGKYVCKKHKFIGLEKSSI